MRGGRTELLVCRDLHEMSRRAAELFVRLADTAVSSSGRFTVALSGGATPKGLYTLLAGDQFRPQVSWSRVHLFWGDERCVPPDHPESNYRMVRELLLDRVPIPQHNVHRMPAEDEDPARAGAEYETTLRAFFEVDVGEFPRFDLILLGLGQDGHTASLFPGTAALAETERLVASTDVEQHGTVRLTLTVPVINRAASVVFVVAGEAKASVLRGVLGDKRGPERLPAQRIQPVSGKLWFIVDRAAAKELTLPGARET
ncbi:MAG: 6-phosphogluconolactonase [Candidatus Methylomirabilales bacterium]